MRVVLCLVHLGAIDVGLEVSKDAGCEGGVWRCGSLNSEDIYDVKDAVEIEVSEEAKATCFGRLKGCVVVVEYSST